MDDIYYQEREAEVYDLEYQYKTDDIEFWIALANEYAGGDGTALELACGTCRVLLPVAASGVRVVGVDVSPWMLARAKKKLGDAPPEVQERVGLLEADILTLKLEQKFDFIYLPFNTFLFFKTVQDQLAVFDMVRKHLKRGGVFAMDIFVPDVNRLAQTTPPPKWGLDTDETLGDLGLRFQRDAVTTYDTLTQKIFATFRMKEYRDNVLEREWLADLELTYIFPRELEHLVARAGFEFVNYWGDYDRTDFWKLHAPTKQLTVLRAR